MKFFFETKLSTYFLKSLLFIYPALFIWQGGDLTDSGYHATNYFYFFENFSLGKTNSLTLFTNFIGGCWLKIFPGIGVLGLKFLYLVFLYAVIVLSYKILSPFQSNKSILSLFLLCGVAFATRYTMFVFNYDIVSWMFVLLSGYFILKNNKHNRSYLFGGIAFAFAVLSKFSEITFLFTLPVFLFLIYKSKISHFQDLHWKKILGFYLRFLAGFSAIIMVFIIVLAYYTKLDAFIDNLGFFNFSTKSSASSSYSLLHLLRGYVNEISVLLFHILITTCSGFLLSKVYELGKKHKMRYVFIPVFILVYYFAFQYYFGFHYSSKFSFLVPAFSFPILAFVILEKGKYSFTALLLFTLCITTVLGTNTGLVLKMSFGFIPLLSLTFLILYDIKEWSIYKFNIKSKPILISAFLIILSFSFFARLGWIYNVNYGSWNARIRAIYSIQHPSMKFQYTPHLNALEIPEVVNAIDTSIRGNNSLFIYGHKPMYYYLTKHNPPIKEYWLGNNVYTTKEIFNAIERSIATTNKWPMIVDTKQNIKGKEGQVALEEFLVKNDYCIHHSSKIITIWKKQ